MDFTTGLPSSGDPDGGLVAGADGNLWFTDGTAVGRVSVGGQVTTFTLSATADATYIAAGPDGNLWVTDDGTPRGIWRVTPTGAATEFTTANGLDAGALPDFIAAGADGNM